MDPRLLTCVETSRQWYDDVFAVHGIPTGADARLWWAEGAPPRWHSAVKTLEPTDDPAEALVRMAPHPHGTVADSFGLLDLRPHGFDLLIGATWLHHPGVPGTGPVDGWSRVADPDLLRTWNEHQDTVGVLVDELLQHPRFTVLARHDDGVLVSGAVLHDGATAVGLSNTWTAPGVGVRVADLLALAAHHHPGRAVVDYATGEELERAVAAGFEPLGPQHVWIR